MCVFLLLIDIIGCEIVTRSHCLGAENMIGLSKHLQSISEDLRGNIPGNAPKERRVKCDVDSQSAAYM